MTYNSITEMKRWKMKIETNFLKDKTIILI